MTVHDYATVDNTLIFKGLRHITPEGAVPPGVDLEPDPALEVLQGLQRPMWPCGPVTVPASARALMT